MLKKLIILFTVLTLKINTHWHFPHPPTSCPRFLKNLKNRLKNLLPGQTPPKPEKIQKEASPLHNLLNKIKNPPKCLEKFQDRLTKTKEMLQIQLNYNKLQNAHENAKKSLKDINSKLLMVVNFNMVILDFIKNNKQLFKSIEAFKGHFVIKASQKEIPAIMKEFMEKLIGIQKRESVTLQMSKEIAENLMKLQNHKRNLEDLHKIHEENLKLINEKMSEFKKIFSEVVKAIQEMEKKYGPEVVNEQKEKKENKIEAKEVKKPSEDELKEFEERLKRLEESNLENKKKVEDLLVKQEDIKKIQNIMKKKVDNTKIIEDGLDQIQRNHNEDTNGLMDDIDDLKKAKENVDFMKHLEDLSNALNSLQE